MNSRYYNKDGYYDIGESYINNSHGEDILFYKLKYNNNNYFDYDLIRVNWDDEDYYSPVDSHKNASTTKVKKILDNKFNEPRYNQSNQFSCYNDMPE